MGTVTAVTHIIKFNGLGIAIARFGRRPVTLP